MRGSSCIGAAFEADHSIAEQAHFQADRTDFEVGRNWSKAVAVVMGPADRSMTIGPLAVLDLEG